VNTIANEIPFYVQPAGDWIKDIGEETERMVSEIRAQFCVIDTQGLFHAGDENSNTEIKQFLIKPLQAIAARTGCAFMLIHHLSKPGKDRPTGRHQIRGASAFVDDTDLSMMLEAPDGIKKPRRNLIFTKNRNGPHPEDVGLEYVSEEARFRTFDSVESEAVRREMAAAEHAKHIAEMMDRMEMVVRTRPNLNGKQIIEMMGKGRRADFIEAKSKLLDAYRIFAEPQERGAMTYYAANK
jgi:RecA-family ATPase